MITCGFMIKGVSSVITILFHASNSSSASTSSLTDAFFPSSFVANSSDSPLTPSPPSSLFQPWPITPNTSSYSRSSISWPFTYFTTST